MTQPLTNHPSWLPIAALIGVGVVVVAIPFGKRQDWTGTLALIALGAVALGVWGLMLARLAQSLWAWWYHRNPD